MNQQQQNHFLRRDSNLSHRDAGGGGHNYIYWWYTFTKMLLLKANMLTRTSSRLGIIANLHAQVFDPQHPQVTPLVHDAGHRMNSLVDMFYIFFVRTHTKFGIKIFVIKI